MRHPVTYSNEEWASWYVRARIHTRVAPGLTDDLRSSTGPLTPGLIATAEASLAELDDDIVAGEFLAHIMQSSDTSTAVSTIVEEMSRIAQDLLQAIVEVRSAGDAASQD